LGEVAGGILLKGVGFAFPVSRSEKTC
jgi:hypothetical protein